MWNNQYEYATIYLVCLVDFDTQDEEEDMGNAPDHPAVLDANDENSSSLILTEESPRRALVGMCTFDTGLPCQHSVRNYRYLAHKTMLGFTL